MNLSSIIDATADRADDLLADATGREQARASLAAALEADYPKLTPAERAQAVKGVMAILEREGFFDWSVSRGGEDDEGDPGARE